ncbi:MAG TPA: YihY/virulence factor BrkB family protein [Pseudonocardiaceae bacterium]|jgi:membrane protein|nr:YihY/virulence factor BrkB family protein [Pseudonocardiaceae bacterium]
MTRHDEESIAGEVRGTLQWLDRYQQRHPALGVPIAVVRKFVEDQSTILASAIAFWAFFSVFPLLLVFVTLLGYFLPPNLQGDVLSRVAAFVPLLSTDTIGHLSGQWWTLLLGIFSALWSGSFVVTTTQAAFNSVWELPYAQRPAFGAQIGRSLVALSAIGITLVGGTVISSYITGTKFGVVGGLAGYLIPVALDVGLFIVAFRLLTDREVSTRDVLPGALLSGVVFWLLQQLSSLIISRYLHTAERAYGNFATVITMLWWFYLGSIVTLFGAQLNVVLKERLHPRGLVDSPATEADYRAYDAYAKERTYHHDEGVHTEFPHHDADEG